MKGCVLLGPGFIHDELDLKVLILYLLCRTEGPVELADLTSLTLLDDGIDYFTFVQAVADLVQSGHLLLVDGVYTVTEKGRTNSAIMESSLPGVIRGRCAKVLREFNAQARRAAQVTAEVTVQDAGVQVELGLNDGVRSIFSLSMLAPSEEQARAVAERFQKRPEAIFSAILDLLTHDKEGT